VLEVLEDRLAPAVFTVVNNGDTGAGTGLTGDLRYCINQANALAGPNTIQFAIAAGGVQTINLASALPQITRAVTIDGYTEAGASANTLAVGDNAVLTVVLNGARSINVGLAVASSSVTIRGLVIQNFTQYGVSVSGNPLTPGQPGPSGVVIAGNFIGTSANGTVAAGNGAGTPGQHDTGGGTGGVIFQAGASGNTLGGAAAADRNLISGNTGEGVVIVRQDNDPVATANNTVRNNYIGTDVTGTQALGNNCSGVFAPFSGGNQILDNLVSGNLGFAGIALGGVQTDGVSIRVGAFTESHGDGSGNVVAGNFVGTNAAGTAVVSNLQHGITVQAGSSMTIGGTTEGSGNLVSGHSPPVFDPSAGQGIYLFSLATGMLVAGNSVVFNTTGIRLDTGAHDNTIGGNVISGNTGNGVEITDSGTSNNVVAGNFIGTNAAGTAALGNDGDGVRIEGGATGNTIGGLTPTPGTGLGNVISGNTGTGVHISGTGTSGNVVEGNLIGTNAAGTAALANLGDGVDIEGEAANNTVGGTADGARNVLSGNQFMGVFIDASAGNVVQGNFIGTDITGAAALGNERDGIFISSGATDNTVGGTTAAARNIISGNAAIGVILRDAGTSRNVVQGNYIGTDVTGTATVANGDDGVEVVFGASGNTIGGTADGARNVISGNGGSGVFLGFQNASGNVVQGNYIGTDFTGTRALGNAGDGVHIEGDAQLGGATGNTVGGTTAAARNVISGNSGDGVTLVGPGTSNNVVAGNFIGTDVSGTAALGNDGNGVSILAGASNNTVGGATAGARNVISGNSGDGVEITDSGTSGNVVAGNLIGTDVTGTVGFGNEGDGVAIQGGATNNTVGGSTAASRNIISGNSGDGVALIGPGTSGNVVAGNFIGTNVNGTAALANVGDGVAIQDGATSNTVGGTTAGARNVISGNSGDGVALIGPGTSGNVVAGNFIGINAAGTAALGNVGDGVSIQGGAFGNTIGGTAAGAGNLIAFNANGVVVIGIGSVGNSILGNSIFANDGLGIDLGRDGVTLNDSVGHSGPNDFQDFPILTLVTASGSSRTVFGYLRGRPNTHYRIEFFGNSAFDPSGFGEGQVFLGFVEVTTDASGLATFSFTYTADPAAPALTSTATDLSTGDTSEFSGRDRRQPSNSVPGPQTTNEETPLSFNPRLAVALNDPDNTGNRVLQITLTVRHGTLTLGSLAGLTGSGNGTSSLTYTGTVEALNAALAGLTYTPDPEYIGPDSLTLTTSDLTAPELGGPEVVTSAVPITVREVVQPPVLVVSDARGNEGQAIPLDIRAATQRTDGTETLRILISGVPATASLSAGTFEGNGVWTLTGDQLSGLLLYTTDNFTATLTVTAVSTRRATGSSAAATRTLTVTVTDVPPTATPGNSGPVRAFVGVTVFLLNPFDPSSADVAAGFRYSFALSTDGLADSYDAAEASSSRTFVFTLPGIYTVHERIFDKDNDFTDYTTTVVVFAVVPTPDPGPTPDQPPPILPPTNPGIPEVPGPAPAFPVNVPQSHFLLDPGGTEAPPAIPTAEPSALTSSDLGVTFDNTFGPAAVVSLVDAALRKPHGGPLDGGGADEQSTSKALRVVSAVLDADDNVAVVEDLLRRNTQSVGGNGEKTPGYDQHQPDSVVPAPRTAAVRVDTAAEEPAVPLAAPDSGHTPRGWWLASLLAMPLVGAAFWLRHRWRLRRTAVSAGPPPDETPLR
jgi:hypothetical protein